MPPGSCSRGGARQAWPCPSSRGTYAARRPRVRTCSGGARRRGRSCSPSVAPARDWSPPGRPPRCPAGLRTTPPRTRASPPWCARWRAARGVPRRRVWRWSATAWSSERCPSAGRRGSWPGSSPTSPVPRTRASCSRTSSRWWSSFRPLARPDSIRGASAPPPFRPGAWRQYLPLWRERARRPRAAGARQAARRGPPPRRAGLGRRRAPRPPPAGGPPSRRVLDHAEAAAAGTVGLPRQRARGPERRLERADRSRRVVVAPRRLPGAPRRGALVELVGGESAVGARRLPRALSAGTRRSPRAHMFNSQESSAVYATVTVTPGVGECSTTQGSNEAVPRRLISSA